MIIDFLTVNLKHALADEVTRAQSAETALRAESFASAVYDSGDTAIYFYNADDEVLSTIDCTDFIVDGMIDNVTLSGSILTITFNTDSGKQDITIDLSEFINPANYYTKSEVDSAITVATEDFVTSGEVKTQIEGYNYITSADTVDFVTSGALTNVEFVVSTALNELNNSLNTLSADTADFVTSGDVETQITNKNYITSADTANFVTSGDVETQITSKGYITSAATQNMVTSTDITSIVKISQADYDLLPSKDPNTLYIII